MRRLVLILLAANLLPAQDRFLGTTQFGPRRGTAEHELLGITPSIGASVYYGDGIGGYSLGANGRPADASSGAFSITGAVSGTHYWKRDVLAVSYATGYYQSFKFDQKNHVSEALSTGWTHEFSPRTVVSITNSLGLWDRAFGAPGMAGMSGLGGMPYLSDGYLDPNSGFLPNNEVLDGQVLGAGLSGDISHNISRDWAVSAGGTAFTMLRTGSNLINTYGTTARGQVSRRVGRRGSLGVGYGYSFYTYTKGIGDMTAHSVQLVYSRQFLRNVSFSLSAGALRAERIGVERFSVDPAIQAILGISTATQIVYGVNYFGTGSASISRSFRRHSVSLGGNLGTTPGNGLYAGSRSLDGHASYAYSGFGSWGFAASCGYTRYQSLMFNLKPYDSVYATTGVSRRLIANISMSLSGGVRHTNSGNVNYARDYAYGSFSLAYAPGSFRLPSWW